MSEPVNLRQARKTRRRAEDARNAEENRLRFGMSGAERRTAEAVETLEERRHAGHFRSGRQRGKTSDECESGR